MFYLYRSFKLLALIFVIYPILLFSSDSGTTTFYVVRHGQTDWNVEKRIQGFSDIPLNDHGREEALSLALELRDIHYDVCISSDLQRAYETALILTSNIFPSIEIVKDERLRERDSGIWDGRYYKEYYSATSEEKLGVETSDVLLKRSLECLQDISEKYSGGSLLIVSHGGVMRNMLLHFLALNCAEEEITTSNMAIFKLVHSNDQWTLEILKGITIPN